MTKPLNQNKMKKLTKEISSHFPLIINLSHQKGGVGKSTLAYNIADSFRILGYKVKLLDIDIQNSCIGLNSLREIPFVNIKKVSNRKELVDIINNSYSDNSEILIIDTDGFDLTLSKLAIIGSDISLAPLSDRVTEILGLVQKYNQTLKEIEPYNQIDISNYILLNKIHPFAKDFKHIEEIISQYPQIDIFKSIIVRDRAIYDKSFIDGRTVFEASELKGHKEAMDEILSICYKLMEIEIDKGVNMAVKRKRLTLDVVKSITDNQKQKDNMDNDKIIEKKTNRVKLKDLEKFSKSVRFPLVWKEEIEKKIDYPTDLSSFIVEAIKEKMEREEMNIFIG